MCAAGPGGANRTPPRARHPTAIVLVPHSRRVPAHFIGGLTHLGHSQARPRRLGPNASVTTGRDEDPEWFMVLVVEEF